LEQLVWYKHLTAVVSHPWEHLLREMSSDV
jgi:hypothetical protein